MAVCYVVGRAVRQQLLDEVSTTKNGCVQRCPVVLQFGRGYAYMVCFGGACCGLPGPLGAVPGVELTPAGGTRGWVAFAELHPFV